MKLITPITLVLISGSLARADDPVPPPTPAQPTVKLPATMTARPGLITQIQVETNGQLVQWDLYTPSDDKPGSLIPFPPDGKMALFSAPNPGTYTVIAWTALNGIPSKSARCVITVASPVPPPPPVPPTPPVNPYRARFKAAYDADLGDAAKKDSTRRDLAELYRQAVSITADRTVATTTQLHERIKAAAKSLAADQLVGTRTAIAEVVGGVLPPDTSLTDEGRKTAATLFGQIADALSW